MLPDELNEILDRRILRLGMTIDDDAQERIVNLSRGLPAYVHSLGKFAARSAVHGERLHIEEKDVDLAVDNVLKRSQHQVHESYTAAVHSNNKGARCRQSLLACAGGHRRGWLLRPHCGARSSGQDPETVGAVIPGGRFPRVHQTRQVRPFWPMRGKHPAGTAG
jgi:hypothetical protein